MAYTNVNYCVNTVAAAGDTVIVPAGSATWASTLAISKSVILIGAGVDITTITNGNINYIITIIPATPVDDPVIQISGITFNSTSSGHIYIANENATYDVTKIRIYNNKFQNASSSQAIYVRGMVFGLVDNNVFSGNYYDFNLRGYDTASWNKYTKAGDNTLVYGHGTPGVTGGKYDHVGMGSARFFYIEANTFFNTTQFIVASGEGSRWAFRYNTLSENNVAGFLDIHGDTSNDGCVAVEVYENKQTTSSGTGNYSASMWVDYRGGTAMIFNNSVACDTGLALRALIKIREEYGGLRAGYDMKIHNGYMWNNKNSVDNYNMWMWHHEPAGDNDPLDLLGPGVDYWSDATDGDRTASSYWTSGLAANRPGTCSAAVIADVYWETDTRKLYRCTATNTWTFIYEPYTYPHPLSRILPPKNLKIK